jgi:hypothetical protein
MGSYGDDRYGGDRWRDRDQSRNRDYGREQGRGGSGGYGRDDDRGFLDRAGDELRSWFGDDEAQRRREADQRRWEQEQRMTGRRDNDYGDRGPGSLGGGGFGGGWGNQRGDSWNRERPGERGSFGGSDERHGGGERHYARGEREGWFTDSRGGERGERYGGSGGGSGGSNYGSGYGVERAEEWGSSGFGGEPDRGRRFDRVDAGSTGTHGAHPMSAATGGGMGGAYGASSTGSGSSSRYAAIMHEQGGQDRGGGFGGDSLRGQGQGGHDPHYSEWRRRQIEDLDRDYDEWRREHQSRFEQEFGSWRSTRCGAIASSSPSRTRPPEASTIRSPARGWRASRTR